MRASHSPVPPLVSSRPFRNKCSIPLSRLCHSCLAGGRALSVRSRAVVGVFAGSKVCIVFLQGHPVPPSFRSTSSVSFTGRLAWFSLGGSESSVCGPGSPNPPVPQRCRSPRGCRWVWQAKPRPDAQLPRRGGASLSSRGSGFLSGGTESY